MIEKAITYLEEKGAKFYDVRLEKKSHLSINIINGEIRSISDIHSTGLSIRVHMGGGWGYASTTNFSWESIKSACDHAFKLAKVLSERNKTSIELHPISISETRKAEVLINPKNVDLSEKLEISFNFDSAMRNYSEKIVNSNVIYRESIFEFSLMNSAGADLSWEEIRVGIIGYPVAMEEGKLQYSFESISGTGGFEIIKNSDLEEKGAEIAKEAVDLLSATKPPSGLITVIADPSVSGVLAHEVMGHASEADEIIKKRSFLTGKVGEIVASDLITMVDDGTVKRAYGSIPYDSEGTPSSRTIIIDRGIYKGYMHSLETAAVMGTQPTGNGRAQDFNRRVFVRMTNTFFERGEWRLEEIIEDTQEGLLALKSLGGMEDPVGGGFETKVLMGYVIRNGEKQELVRGFTLSGKALEILKTVDAVSRDFKLESGFCGKGEEDYVPVSTGGPYIRAKILVGGG